MSTLNPSESIRVVETAFRDGALAERLRMCNLLFAKEIDTEDGAGTMIEDSELVRQVARAIFLKMAENLPQRWDDCDPARSPAALAVALAAIKTLRAYDRKKPGKRLDA
jgi:hypothetical protein